MEITIVLLRIIHIFAAVFWVGAAWIGAFFLEPTARALGPDGGKFMGYLVTVRKYSRAVMIAAVLTLLAGWILYFMHYGIAGLQTRVGLAFALGGVVGLIAGGFGGAVGATSTRLTRLGGEIAQQGKPPSSEQAAEMGALQKRLRTLGLWTAILTTIALLLMTTARYA